MKAMRDKSRTFGVVIVLSGPSGAGKTTVYREILATRDDLEFSISCTTRPPRLGEVEARDYFFLDRATFLSRRANGEFLESAEVHGNLYGTLRSQVERRIDAGVNVLLDVDVQGARQVRDRLRGTDLGEKTIFVFTAPPDIGILASRLHKRGTDDEAVIKTRLANAKNELTAWRDYDYLLVNDSVGQAVADFVAIIDAARQKTSQWRIAPWEAARD